MVQVFPPSRDCTTLPEEFCAPPAKITVEFPGCTARARSYQHCPSQKSGVSGKLVQVLPPSVVLKRPARSLCVLLAMAAQSVVVALGSIASATRPLPESGSAVAPEPFAAVHVLPPSVDL